MKRLTLIKETVKKIVQRVRIPSFHTVYVTMAYIIGVGEIVEYFTVALNSTMPAPERLLAAGRSLGFIEAMVTVYVAKINRGLKIKRIFRNSCIAFLGIYMFCHGKPNVSVLMLNVLPYQI
jgi:hypothetical protein